MRMEHTKEGDTCTSNSYESLVRVHDPRGRGETIESGELREWRHTVKATTDAHLLVYRNGWQLQ